eukprot:m.315625 g.315625  ORF g.315625 m.315625 type:complete len:104 (+) comp23068_c0_seq42:37-348(+)
MSHNLWVLRSRWEKSFKLPCIFQQGSIHLVVLSGQFVQARCFAERGKKFGTRAADQECAETPCGGSPDHQAGSLSHDSNGGGTWLIARVCSKASNDVVMILEY